MNVGWMFLILLGCRLLRASQPQNTSTCNGELQTGCKSNKVNVHVPCPNVTASELTFTLYKDNTVISSVKCNHSNTLNCSQPNKATMIKDPISFIPTECSQGIYRCEGTVFFPPPLKVVPSDVRVEVVEGHQCTSSKAKLESPRHEFVWIWIMVVSLLTVYSVTATIAAFVIWIKLRTADSQSDYMNTKPRAPRDRKKRGVQNLITRHF